MGMVPIAGLLIDRLQRSKLMTMTNGWLFAINLAMGLLLLGGYSQLKLLFIFTFLSGMAQTVDTSMRQVAIFDLVPRRMAPNSVAMVQTGWGLMRSFGPGLGGFLILWIGAGGNFLVQAGVYILILVTIMKIRFPLRRPQTVQSSALDSIREGLRYIAKNPVTRAFMLIGFTLPIFIIPTFFILPAVYAKDVFQGGADVQGLLMSFAGIGGIAGGFAIASLGRIEYRGRLLMGSLFLVSISLIGFSFSTSLWMALPFLATAGFFEMIFLATNQTLLQLSIPDHMRGRVTAMVNLNMILAPMGGMIAGVGVDLLGGPRMITIIMSSIAAAIACFVLIACPTVRNYRLSDAIGPSQD
jgi:MFS family permease